MSDLAAEYEAALERYREEPTAEHRTAYRAAADALAQARAAERGDRAGMSVTAESAEG